MDFLGRQFITWAVLATHDIFSFRISAESGSGTTSNAHSLIHAPLAATFSVLSSKTGLDNFILAAHQRGYPTQNAYLGPGVVSGVHTEQGLEAFIFHSSMQNGQGSFGDFMHGRRTCKLVSLDTLATTKPPRPASPGESRKLVLRHGFIFL